MRIQKLIFALAILALSAAASASRWVEVTDGDGVKIYADTESARRNGQIVRVWLRWVYQAPRPVTNSNPQKHFLSQKTLELYHCERRTAATIQIIRYAEGDGGEIVESLSGADAPEQYSEVVPETVGEGILKYVCSRNWTTKR